MCGIVGYVGAQPAMPLLLSGLHRLEYRGYDSAGIAVVSDGALEVYKEVGNLSRLQEMLAGVDLPGRLGIGHTRWATHGEPTTHNAHPHTDCSGTIAVVHNGIIENCEQLRRELIARGHRFRSDTDTEVFCHLIEEYADGDLLEAVGAAISKVIGAYGICVISSRHPGLLVAARNGSPLIVGVGDGENFVASDVPAIAPYTQRVIYMEDGEVIAVTPEGVRSIAGKDALSARVHSVGWEPGEIEKGDFPHFMLKEIHEQPEAIERTVSGRLIESEGDSHLGGLNMTPNELLGVTRIVIIGCGTSWHAGLIGEYMLEENACLPVEVEYASEFRYRNPVIQRGDLVIAISQSGETADTIAAVREAQRRGARVLGIVNVVGSTIARLTDGGVYLRSGPEIGVASTKAFTGTLAVLFMIALHLGRQRHTSNAVGRTLVRAMQALPSQMRQVLAREEEIAELATRFVDGRNALYLGRGYSFPVALEGALKLKEISYIHAEGYPAAEMKHGPIALIDKNMPVVVVAPQDSVYDKVVSNIEEIRTRRGQVIAVATEGDTAIASKADHVIYIPQTLEILTPLLAVVPLQLLAYHIAVLRGCPVDQPKNLAKSVTVE
ncbi:glutamine--fructose-6-phosphate transaminase (isomerizing) [Candidatus Fermentibacteria bacterium]|nr:glutamine--fructose-6-phosphate transaminase (isomerizing) [Candidatus Fermentibacteria bacterium]